MKIPLSRIMALILIVGISLGIIRFAYLSFKYTQKNDFHKMEKARAEAVHVDWDDKATSYKLSSPKDPVRAAYHARMAEKYRKASDYPWIPGNMDTPEP